MFTKLSRSGKSRRIAFKYYKPICVWCGVSISDLLEVAHIDHNRSNDDPKNLVFLCLTHHRMLDLGLIPSDVVTQLRDRPLKADWSILIKGAPSKNSQTTASGQQQLLTFPKTKEPKDTNQKTSLSSAIQKEAEIEKIMIKRREAALKAWATRRAQNPTKFGKPTRQDQVLLQKMKKEKEKNKVKNHSNNFEIIRSLAAYEAHLTRRQRNPEIYGKVTEDLTKNIKRLEQKLKIQ
ncbi:MAG: HNH endonuclease [Nitrosopumilales archaeon]|nr:HNH endonuclease [Nitrosopumilales archaeon]